MSTTNEDEPGKEEGESLEAKQKKEEASKDEKLSLEAIQKKAKQKKDVSDDELKNRLEAAEAAAESGKVNLQPVNTPDGKAPEPITPSQDSKEAEENVDPTIDGSIGGGWTYAEWLLATGVGNPNFNAAEVMSSYGAAPDTKGDSSFFNASKYSITNSNANLTVKFESESIFARDKNETNGSLTITGKKSDSKDATHVGTVNSFVSAAKYFIDTRIKNRLPANATDEDRKKYQEEHPDLFVVEIDKCSSPKNLAHFLRQMTTGSLPHLFPVLGKAIKEMAQKAIENPNPTEFSIREFSMKSTPEHLKLTPADITLLKEYVNAEVPKPKTPSESTKPTPKPQGK